MNALPLSGVIAHPYLQDSLGRPTRYQITETSENPDIQVEQTIALMRSYTVTDSRSPDFQADVMRAIQTSDVVGDVWNYLNRTNGIRSMQFVRDENTASEFGKWRPVVEALIRPVDQATLTQAQGDCDDFCMYGAAHLLARGVPCSFVTIAADSTDPGAYSHVYLAAYPKSGPRAGKRVVLDLSHGDYCGWEYQRPLRKTEWPVETVSSVLPIIFTFISGAFVLWLAYKGGVL